MRVRFVVSYSYNDILARLKNEKFDMKKWKELEMWTKRFEKLWIKHESIIFRRISKYSGLKWRFRKHVCFIQSYILGLSFPLTIKAHENQYISIQTLIHELIHINLGKIAKRDKNFVYMTHLPLYLIYKRVWEDTFPKISIVHLKPELKKKEYVKAIKIAKELEPLWRKSKKDMRAFIKQCISNGLV